ncbi:hypothetical protein [Streptomyces sp. TR06-5]|uniref:hypothetical protein n=1 Tax=Streptomyces sp. TR06-5 TaxID=3385976 RepID=UPI00399FED5F
MEDGAWLAVTFRRLAPAELDVVFCDKGYSFDVHLRPEVPVDGLVESVNAA